MFYVIDDNNNRKEALDKEGVLAVLQQAIASGDLSFIDANSAFVSKLKCCVGGDTYPFAFVTQAKYNELVANNNIVENCYYIITDDTTCEDLDELLEQITTTINELIDANKDIDDAITYLEKDVIELQDTTSKQSEAKQYISYENFSSEDLIYDSSLDTKPRVDISSLMLKGKTVADTIGMYGRIIINENTTPHIDINFTAMWNLSNFNLSDCHAYSSSTAAGLWLIRFQIGIDDNNRIYLNSIKGINMLTNEEVEITKVRVYHIGLYYK